MYTFFVTSNSLNIKKNLHLYNIIKQLLLFHIMYKLLLLFLCVFIFYFFFKSLLSFIYYKVDNCFYFSFFTISNQHNPLVDVI